jgi:hypothetical protein
MYEIKELHEDQWKWLNKFESINLTHWRCVVFQADKNKHNLFMYVGNPCDNSSDREKNLRSNRYYYWPE